MKSPAAEPVQVLKPSTQIVNFSTVDGREINYAVVHAGIFIPGVGNLTTTLETGKVGDKLSGLKMTVQGDFVILELKGQTIGIPMTNVSHFRFK